MKIYTRTGDTGETSLFDGTRVRKDDPRVDAYGEVDELNAWIGFAHAEGLDPILDKEVSELQRDLFAVAARLADPAEKISLRVAKVALGEEHVERLERLIDRLDADLPALRHFVLPGGSPSGAAFHVARAVCRRAERRMIALTPPVEAVLIRYINRLSDLLFVMARWSNHRSGVPDPEW
jgi:cob(I)alamin adenosyltransferase